MSRCGQMLGESGVLLLPGIDFNCGESTLNLSEIGGCRSSAHNNIYCKAMLVGPPRPVSIAPAPVLYATNEMAGDTIPSLSTPT